MSNLQVISLGGSTVAPDGVDVAYLRRFRMAVDDYLSSNARARMVIVVGGGMLARRYQQAFREIVESASEEEQDWVGISATRLNARLLKAVFSDYCREEVVSDPETQGDFAGRVLIGAGWKPGFSTDLDAVILAQRLGATTVVNLTDVSGVYSADPRNDATARLLEKMTWSEFRTIIGGEWKPGAHAPFDPIAAKRASEAGLSVVCVDGRNIENLGKLLVGESFTGTTIGPE